MNKVTEAYEKKYLNSISYLFSNKSYHLNKTSDGKLLITDEVGFIIEKEEWELFKQAMDQFYNNDNDEFIENYNGNKLSKFSKETEIRKAPVPRKKREGVIYFIKSDNGLIKIGMTKDIEIRFKALQQNSPFKLEVLKTIQSQDIKTDEEHFHKKYADKRIIGEWFDLSTEDIKQIMNME